MFCRYFDDSYFGFELVEPLAPRRKSVFGRLQTFAQLGRAPARPESENCLTKVEARARREAPD
jgi:hypothetical protein